MTKSFAAVALLQLRDAGLLALDDPVARYVPEWRR
jgi:CubicO group peptidase (beta-lactamase class C family)